MKTKKEKSTSRVLRQVGGKNILFVNEEAVGEIELRRELDYDPGDPVGDVSNALMSISYLMESLSENGNKEVDGVIVNGLSLAARYYAEDVHKYLRPRNEDNFFSTSMKSPLKLVPLAVRK